MAKNSRWVSQALILSATLNVVLIAIFFYFVIRASPLHFSYTPKIEEIHSLPPCNKSFLKTLNGLPYSKLLELLKDERIIESGFRVKEFALGALATVHHFDVQRALGKKILEKKIWTFEDQNFCLFPGLKISDFQQIELFSQNEIWPYTTQGLFLEIQRKTLEGAEKELIFQFCHSSEFVVFETLFARSGQPIQRGQLMAMILSQPWDRFSKWTEDQAMASDFSDKKRRELLLSYIESGSKEAALIFLKTDANFIIQELGDLEIGKILDLLPANAPETLNFSKKIAASPRSQKVFEKAKLHLSQAEIATARTVRRPSIGELRPKFREPKPASPDPRTHIVQPGESLWLIAKKYQISIDALMQANGLQSTVIQSGRVLKIP